MRVPFTSPDYVNFGVDTFSWRILLRSPEVMVDRIPPHDSDTFELLHPQCQYHINHRLISIALPSRSLFLPFKLQNQLQSNLQPLLLILTSLPRRLFKHVLHRQHKGLRNHIRFKVPIQLRLRIQVIISLSPSLSRPAPSFFRRI